jgi:hypothetical protein
VANSYRPLFVKWVINFSPFNEHMMTTCHLSKHFVSRLFQFFLVLLDRLVKPQQIEQSVSLQHGPGSKEAPEKSSWKQKIVKYGIIFYVAFLGFWSYTHLNWKELLKTENCQIWNYFFYVACLGSVWYTLDLKRAPKKEIVKCWIIFFMLLYWVLIWYTLELKRDFQMQKNNYWLIVNIDWPK